MVKDKEKLDFQIILPDTLPLSIIAKKFEERINENNVKEIFIIAVTKLFCKYIDPSQAMLEINISSDIRTNLIEIFKKSDGINEHIDNILCLFKAAVNEICVLMHNSASRFRQEPIFKEVVNQIETGQN